MHRICVCVRHLRSLYIYYFYSCIQKAIHIYLAFLCLFTFYLNRIANNSLIHSLGFFLKLYTRKDTLMMKSTRFPAEESANITGKGLNRALPKHEQVYRRIKDMILHYEIQPGQRIQEDEMASLLQTSRTPVREGLRKLSGEGLITIYPKRYAEVTYFTPEMAKKIGVIRMSQDILAGHLAIYYGSDADFSRLQQLADACEESHRNNDLYGRITADRAFHLSIAEIAQNDILLKYQKEIYYRIHLIHLQTSSLKDDSDERIAYHQQLIDSLYRRDEQSYVQAVAERCQAMYDLDAHIVSLYAR